MSHIYTPAIEMMKEDPAIHAVVIERDNGYYTLSRPDNASIMLRVEMDGLTWSQLVWVKEVKLTRSSGAYNVSDDEYAVPPLRIKTPPRSPEEEEALLEAFSTPTPRVRRAQPPPLVRTPSYLPPPSGPLMRSCCSLGSTCSDFQGIVTPSPAVIEANAKPVNRHLFFDKEGNEVTREEYEQLQQNEEEKKDDEDERWGIKIPRPIIPLTARHPRVLLAYFRFVHSYNEDADIPIVIPRMSKSAMDLVLDYVEGPPPEFEQEVEDLKYYLDKVDAGEIL